jgi:hypothetical protein
VAIGEPAIGALASSRVALERHAARSRRLAVIRSEQRPVVVAHAHPTPIPRDLAPVRRQRTVGMLSSNLMMQDIQIVGADDEMTESEPQSSMKWIYFKLSETPPPEWSELFAEERRFPRHSMWRRTQVYGAHIKVHCPLGEVEMHLRDIQEDVKNANQKYRAWLAQQRQRQAAEAEAHAKDRQEISDALGRLKF